MRNLDFDAFLKNERDRQGGAKGPQDPDQKVSLLDALFGSTVILKIENCFQKFRA